MTVQLRGFSKDRVESMVFNVLTKKNIPHCSGYFTFLGFEPEEEYVTPEQSNAIADFFAPYTLEEAKKEKKQEIASSRFVVETGGFTFNNIKIRTDRESQALITGAALAALQDPNYSCQWKTETGFVVLTANIILALANQLRVFVQSCFDKEAQYINTINSTNSLAALMEIHWE